MVLDCDGDDGNDGGDGDGEVKGRATQRWWSDAKSVNFFLSPIGSE